ncbi:MAG: APC family permease [Deltaproteobacteria bacterium]|nr:APC family permease [Deltaproteobacteria bacterium]
MSKPALQRSLTLLDVVALGVNGVIGTGIFLLPGKWVAFLGPAALLALVFAAVLSFVIALCFAEVSSYFRGTGGAYLYALRTFGDLPGFLVGWMTCVVTVVAWAALANGLVRAVAAFSPMMGEGLPRAAFLIVFMGLLTVVNLRGAKLGAVVANFFTAAKLIPLILFIAVGLFFIDGPSFTPFSPEGYGDFFTATLLIFFAFVGFEGLVVPAGEMAKPRRDVPLALIIVLTLVVIVYALVLCVAIGTLPGLAGHESPIAAAGERFLGGWGGTLIGVGVVVSMVGINAASALVGPRRLFAMAEQGHLPRSLVRLNQHGSPKVAIVGLYVIACALALWGEYEKLALISVIARFAQYIATSVAVFFLRKRGPLPAPGGDGEDTPRKPFRLPLGPVIPVVSVGLCCFMIYQSKPVEQIAGAIAVGAGALVYALMWLRRRG